MTKTLLLMAAKQETRYLPDSARPFMTGIGMVPAAITTTQIILEHKPDRIINLGSVGSLNPQVRGLVVPTVVMNRDMNPEVINATGDPIPDRVSLATAASVSHELGLTVDADGLVSKGELILGTGDSLVVDPTPYQGTCDLVDMEAYSIAAACEKFGIELQMVKHVSDAADDSARSWEIAVDTSARELAKVYEQLA